jgi:hypothetical protein
VHFRQCCSVSRSGISISGIAAEACILDGRSEMRASYSGAYLSPRDWQPRERLSRLCTVPINGVLDQTWDTASYAMEAQILRPLQWFGLLEHRQDEGDASRSEWCHFYRKTALFDRFLSFHVELEDAGSPRH